MIDYFYEISLQDTLEDKIKNEVQSRSDWFNSNGFAILKLPLEIFKDSKIILPILKYKGSPLIFKMEPMTWYDWHIDEHRHCAINMLIEGYDSKCFFGLRESRDIVKLTEVKYEPKKYYLLNTKEKHAVLNLSEPRYLLSIGFNAPNTYKEILEFCKNNKI